MKWDDYLFIIMLLGIVPAAIALIARHIRSGTIWDRLDPFDESSLAKITYHRIFGLRIDDISMKVFVKIGRFEDKLIIKPGLPFRIIGFKPKFIRVSDVVVNNKIKCMQFRVRGELVHVKVVPNHRLEKLIG